MNCRVCGVEIPPTGKRGRPAFTCPACKALKPAPVHRKPKAAPVAAPVALPTVPAVVAPAAEPVAAPAAPVTPVA